MNLVLDIGNTRVKAAVFDGQTIVARYGTDVLTMDFMDRILSENPRVSEAIVASTGAGYDTALDYLAGRMERMVRFGHQVAVPITNLYETPETLGPDRLAAAVGAHHLFPRQAVLIVDIGTAITFDVVSREGEFVGGNISPGEAMRFWALHEFTARLPLIQASDSPVWLGRNTPQAIDSGVVQGIEYEIEGYVARCKEEYGDIVVIFTGGGATRFVNKFKNTIFANYDLVLIGLNRILDEQKV